MTPLDPAARFHAQQAAKFAALPRAARLRLSPAAYQRAYYLAHKAEKAAQRRQYYQTHKTAIDAARRLRRMIAGFEAEFRKHNLGLTVRYWRGDDLAAADAVIREVQS